VIGIYRGNNCNSCKRPKEGATVKSLGEEIVALREIIEKREEELEEFMVNVEKSTKMMKFILGNLAKATGCSIDKEGNVSKKMEL
jgi:hypothetical protein